MIRCQGDESISYRLHSVRNLQDMTAPEIVVKEIAKLRQSYLGEEQQRSSLAFGLMYWREPPHPGR